MTSFDLPVAAVSLRVGAARKDFPLTGGGGGGDGRPVEDTDEVGSPPRPQPVEDEVRAQEGLDYDDESGGGGGGAQTFGPGVPAGRKDISTGAPSGDIPGGLAPVERGGRVRGGRPLTGQNVREPDIGGWHNSDGLSPQATATQLRQHLWGPHAYDVPLPNDRGTLDRMHAADHSQRGECGAHEAKDITSATGGGPGTAIPAGLAPVQRGVGPGGQVRGGRRRRPGEEGGIVMSPRRPALVARQRRTAIPKTRPVNWGEKIAEVTLASQQDPRIAATVDAKNRKVEAWRRTMENVAKAHFDRQRRVVKAKLDSVKGRQWLAAEVKAASDDAKVKGKRLAGRVFDRDTWRKQIADDAAGVLHAQYDDFGADEYARLVSAAGLGGFDVNDPAVRAMIARQAKRLGLIEDTTGDDLADAFGDAYDSGGSGAADVDADDEAAGVDADEGLMARLLGAVDATFDNAVGYRAALIGLVETHSAANAATQAAGGQAYGDNATKSWHTMMDERVRDSHDDMEGVEVALNDPYIVGPSGSPMMYPGDPDGPPEEVIRCRCFQVVNPAGKGRRFHIKTRSQRRSVRVKTWDEAAHPRDEHGRFGTGGGGSRLDGRPVDDDHPADDPPMLTAPVGGGTEHGVPVARVTDDRREWNGRLASQPLAAAWDAMGAASGRAKEYDHPEKYEPNRGFGVHLRAGETETRTDPKSLTQYDVTPVAWDDRDAKRAEGYQDERGEMMPTRHSDGVSRVLMRVPGSERPIPHVYRIVSDEDFQRMARQGHLDSDGRMNLGADEGLVTSDRSTGSFYAVPGDNRIVRIDMRPEDGWRRDPADEYVKTSQKVPFDRVSLVSPVIRRTETTKPSVVTGRPIAWTDETLHDPQGVDKTGEKSVGLSWTVGRTRQVKTDDQPRDDHGRWEGGHQPGYSGVYTGGRLTGLAAAARDTGTVDTIKTIHEAALGLGGADASHVADDLSDHPRYGDTVSDRMVGQAHQQIVKASQDALAQAGAPDKITVYRAGDVADPGGGDRVVSVSTRPTDTFGPQTRYEVDRDRVLTYAEALQRGTFAENELHVRGSDLHPAAEAKSYSPDQERATDGRFGSAAGDHPSKPVPGNRTPRQTAPPVSGNTSGSATATLARTAAAQQTAERNGGHNPQPHDPEPHTPGRQASPAKVNLANLFAHSPHDKLGTKGYCDAKELQRIQKLAIAKIKAAPKPTAADIARNRQSVERSKRPGGELRGNSHDRAARAVKLVKEFGDGTTGHCVYCGRELTKDTVTQDKIRTERQGGRYKYSNLLAACTSCNEHRNDTPIV